ncbi:MAG: HepT-like ribonuclease domain-containing protein [bacterium]
MSTQRDPKKLLYDMLDSCRFLMEFSSGRTLDDLRNDRGFRSGVERELQIIGEALIGLTKSAPLLAEQISEHKRIIRFRHVLVHGYDIVNHEITWAILYEKLAILKRDIEILLTSIEDQ